MSPEKKANAIGSSFVAPNKKKTGKANAIGSSFVAPNKYNFYHEGSALKIDRLAKFCPFLPPLGDKFKMIPPLKDHEVLLGIKFRDLLTATHLCSNVRVSKVRLL